MPTDLRHAFRALTKNPGFSTIAVITLALGIGANTAIFSVVNAVLLRSLPFAEPERIVKVWMSMRDEPRSNHSAADFLDLQRDNQSLAALAGYRNAMFTVAAPGAGPAQIEGAYVTAEFFDVLKAPAALGRTFTGGDAAAGARTIVLGHAAWQQLFGVSSNAAGQVVRVNGEPYTVAGVLRPHAEWPQGSKLWVLSDKRVPPSPVNTAQGEGERDVRYFESIARLKPGVTLEQAQADLSRVARLLQQRQPPGTVTRDLRAGPLREGRV
jgi:putative ABC transport system permease protein